MNSMANKILCLDLALNHSGWSVLHDRDLISYGKILPPKYLSNAEKMIHTNNAIESVLDIWPDINYIVIEDVYYLRNIKTYCTLCQLLGIIRYTAYKYVGNNTFVLSATHVRSSFGLSKKEEVFDFIVGKYNLNNFNFEEHNDVCDSIILGLSFLEKDSVVKTKRMKLVESSLDNSLYEYMLDEYWNNEKSLQSISKNLKVSYGAIHEWFGNFKIPIRDHKFYIDKFPKELSYEQEQILIGTVLGDGGLYKSNKNGGEYCLQISHSTKFRKYLEHKAEKFDVFFSCIFDCFRDDSYLSIFRTVYHPLFSEYAKKFYKKGFKVLPMGLVNKLDPLGIAVWFMDDGYYSDNGYSGVVGLCTHNFSENENNKIAGWFNERFGIDFRVTKQREYFYLKTGKKNNVNKFMDIVRPYIVKSMAYKLKKEN